GSDLQIVVQELDQLASRHPDFSRLRRLVDRIEVVPDMVDTACRRSDDRVESPEAAHKVRLGGGGILLTPAVGHWLPATGLRDGVLNRASELFKQLQGGDPCFREKRVDITGNKEPDFHGTFLLSGSRGRHGLFPGRPNRTSPST